MVRREQEPRGGLAALRLALASVLDPALAVAGGGASPRPSRWLLADAAELRPGPDSPREPDRRGRTAQPGTAGQPWSSDPDSAEADRLIALVDLARGGDPEAFGQLYDHYHPSVYRFVYYRVGAVALAEDLTADTFYRALRSMSTFRWQGKDFGAWLMTIARNVTTDHFKSGRARLEHLTEDMSEHDESTEGPERSVLASLTNQALLGALTELPHEQRECLIMRFLQGLSIAETALVIGRSEGAVKQLQLRAVRNLAKLLPEGVR
ncbi:MAG TPA: sigma-70 family RNA polymerase sigma factor [Nocardioidaceae bacterium]|nr:sigma-70 family RNA polymerase sigma factor [Nocardioidaceae bacterium]